MNEKTLIKGTFTSNFVGVVVEFIVGVIFAIGFILSITLEMNSPLVSVGCLSFVIVAIVGGVMNYNLKNQELTVTDKRVYGVLSRKEIELPLDKISYVESKGGSGMVIATAAGFINCQCCTNRDDVIEVMSSLLKKRNTDFHKDEAVVPCESPSKFNKIDEVRKYKELLDENIITQEEFEKKKKELLEL